MNMSNETCLFVGRFQPFHKGHLLVLQGMVKVCGKVNIVIGSSDAKREADNPFSAEERKEMIQRALQEEDIIPTYDINLVELPDQATDEAWTKACLELVGPVAAVWTGNEATKNCFEKEGVTVKVIKEIPRVSATEVRDRMRAGKDWEELVPEETARYIKEINGVERVKAK